MPVINITLNDDAYNALQDEYRKMAIAWPRPGRAALPPGFDEWLAARAIGGEVEALPRAALDDVRTFTAIEKLITRLAQHGFGLAHLAKNDASLPDAARELSESLVGDLNLPSQQRKRIEELIEYYAKSAKEIADLGRVGVTNRAYGALHEACRDLVERTGSAVDRLGEERGVGRAEGAIAMLVSLGVMDRKTGTEKTEAFKLQARDSKKRSA
ncbi:hypothetical protein D3870_06710 [Noviherbaspirillum cavernae]|uniref:Uncharacterized protein n=1 Tax=Noviherbaspirillum cavernae TaxID=2320862 RepID=A0A418WZZ1_9BURK|nr:hypothetical protein [Noviherbaspirillum cavernae]RJG05751.1 hypothetical protein D3870_06710 [Noviherbaspirillum cavernae]